jgi:DNA-binding PadR family transcriptional regulator
VARTPNRSPQTALVLKALLQHPTEWRHGYDLSKRTDLQSGTLYPILIRLAEQGLLEDTWQASDTPGRPPRHVYRLTATGVAMARELIGANRGASRLRPSKASR